MAAGVGPRVVGDTPKHVLNIDWDGTAVPAMWPERPTEFMPGFVQAMLRFHEAGIALRVWTARINPMDPWTGRTRDPEEIAEEIQYIRDTLDAAGLTFIEIYTAPGKPGGSVYIDDKAERYNPGARTWARLADKILLRLNGEQPIFPHHPQEVTT